MIEVLEDKFDLVAITLEGLEETLKAELESCGAHDIGLRTRAVVFKGDNRLMYYANLKLRTALKILKPILNFKAKSEYELYANVRKIEWDEIISMGQTFSISSSVYSQIFTHSQYATLKVKDAIADYFVDKYDSRPSVDTDNPDIKIHLHIYENQCGISLDSSGEILNHRGYRAHSDTAPINECLAAAMIILSGWNGDCDFVDPMCGSGTIAIEAAYIARNIAPGLLRDDFGFMSWADFDEALYEEVYNKTVEEIKDFNHNIYAYDISQKSIDISANNSAIAKVSGDIIFGVQDFLEPNNIFLENAILIFNPPYGDRMKKDDIEFFYKSIGDSLKKNWIGNTAWLITSNFSSLKLLGLSTSKKIKLFNGSLECRFVKYDLYKGSKKSKYSQNEDSIPEKKE